MSFHFHCKNQHSQPTPRMDTTNPDRKNHFYSRDDTLCLFGGNAAAPKDLANLPSKNIAEADEEKKARGGRDAKISKEFGFKSWDAKKVRAIVKCFHCRKPRCIFSAKKDTTYDAATKSLQQKLESIDFRYSCGDLFFDDYHPIGQVITQRQELNCESKAERAYYNHIKRALKVKDVCIHCGEEGSNDFLLCQEQLESCNLTAGRQCFPICVDHIIKIKVLLRFNHVQRALPPMPFLLTNSATTCM